MVHVFEPQLNEKLHTRVNLQSLGPPFQPKAPAPVSAPSAAAHPVTRSWRPRRVGSSHSRALRAPEAAAGAWYGRGKGCLGHAREAGPRDLRLVHCCWCSFLEGGFAKVPKKRGKWLFVLHPAITHLSRWSKII